MIILFAVFAFSQRTPAVEAEQLITPIPQADPNQMALEQLKAQREYYTKHGTAAEPGWKDQRAGIQIKRASHRPNSTAKILAGNLRQPRSDGCTSTRKTCWASSRCGKIF